MRIQLNQSNLKKKKKKIQSNLKDTIYNLAKKKNLHMSVAFIQQPTRKFPHAINKLIDDFNSSKLRVCLHTAYFAENWKLKTL